MASLKIFAFCAVCSMFSLVSSSPVNLLLTTNGQYYQLVPLSQHSHFLKRISRDIFPDTTDVAPAQIVEVENHTENIQQDKDGAGEIDINGREAIEISTEKQATTEKKELLKPISEDSLSLVKLLHRSRRDHDRYADSDDYYDDRDYGGYDRKGSDVGYMDQNDDFPTVVW